MIKIEIDGVEKKMANIDAKQLYDQLGLELRIPVGWAFTDSGGYATEVAVNAVSKVAVPLLEFREGC